MNSNAPSPKILLITSDRSSVDQIRAVLAMEGGASFDLEWVRQLPEGIACLNEQTLDAVVFDLSLPDSNGIEAFETLLTVAPDVPVVILGDEGNEALAKQIVERGALDYILRDHLDGYSLPRLLRNAIARKAAEDALYFEKERALVTLNSIGDAVLCIDMSGEITYLNLVAETMTGWQREEAIGKPLAEVFRII